MFNIVGRLCPAGGAGVTTDATNFEACQRITRAYMNHDSIPTIVILLRKQHCAPFNALIMFSASLHRPAFGFAAP